MNCLCGGHDIAGAMQCNLMYPDITWGHAISTGQINILIALINRGLTITYDTWLRNMSKTDDILIKNLCMTYSKIIINDYNKFEHRMQSDLIKGWWNVQKELDIIYST